MRAPFQVLAFPFIKERDYYKYAIFKRRDIKIWQGISGGGENNESPLDAIKREIVEETSIDIDLAKIIRLSSITTIPADSIRGLMWGKDLLMIPEIAFGIEVSSEEILFKDEHNELKWVTVSEAMGMLNYDSNKSAIWELDQRLKAEDFKRSINLNRQIIKKYFDKTR